MQSTDADHKRVPSRERSTRCATRLLVQKRGPLVLLRPDHRVAPMHVALRFLGVSVIGAGTGYAFALSERVVDVWALVGTALMFLVAACLIAIPALLIINMRRMDQGLPLLVFDPQSQELIIPPTGNVLKRSAIKSIDTVRVDSPHDAQRLAVEHCVILRNGGATSPGADQLIHISTVSSRRSVAAFAAAAGLKHRDYSVSAQSRRT
ncbi:MAG: hypothetical protein SFY96_04755 [Planctomycetota bacterium]|nr:hypothetical protein [Planctomycetota bacterium]